MKRDLLTNLFRPGASVGAVIGRAGAYAVRVHRSDNGIQVEKTAGLGLPADRAPHPAEIENFVSGPVRELTREKSRIVAGLSHRDADLQFFDLPFSRDDKIRKVLLYEAEPLFLTPVEDLVLDYAPLPEDGGLTRKGVVFGAPEDRIETVIEELETAGLRPDVLLPERLGLLEAGIALFSDSPPGRMEILADLGASQTSLAFFSGPRPVAVRSVFYGGNDISRTLAEKMKIDLYDAEALKRDTGLTESSPAAEALRSAWQPVVMEIRRTMTAFPEADLASGRRLVLGGGGAGAPRLTDMLSGEFGLKTVTVSDMTAESPALGELSSEYLSAFGMALLGLANGRQPNLRQGSFAPPQALQQYRLPLAAMAAGLVLSLLLGLGTIFYDYRVQAAKYNAVKAELSDILTETVPGITRVVAPLAQMEQEVQNAMNAASGFNPAGGRVLDLLLEISKRAGASRGVRVTDFSLSPQTIEMQGEGGSFETIDKLKNDLSALPWFESVTIGGARMDPNTRTLKFKITIKRKG